MYLLNRNLYPLNIWEKNWPKKKKKTTFLSEKDILYKGYFGEEKDWRNPVSLNVSYVLQLLSNKEIYSLMINKQLFGNTPHTPLRFKISVVLWAH